MGSDRRLLFDRRAFIRAAGVPFLASLAPRSIHALEKADAVYASAFRGRDGNYGLATLTEDGKIVAKVTLPARGHGLAASPATETVVVFARRPGTFFMAIDQTGRNAPIVMHSPEGRHFYGHGQFSADGRILYASENDFDNNRGIIGLYDARGGFRRIGEFDAQGIGTHDMTLSADGRMIVVANGGIETHPDFGRTKLNQDHMQPSLVLLDAATGGLIEKHSLPDPLRRLSIRHVDVGNDGRIWFACQYEGPRNDRPPLVGSIAKGADLRFVTLPAQTTERLANYVGAIAVNRSAGLVGFTSPNGNALVTLDERSGVVLTERDLADAAGVARSSKGVIASSYRGRFSEEVSEIAWDQHIVRTKG